MHTEHQQKGLSGIGMRVSESWYGYAGAFGANAIVLGVLSGFTSALSIKGAILPIVAALACSASFVAAGRRNVDERWLHVGPAASFALYLLSALVLAPGSFAAFAVLFITVMLAPASINGLRFAAPHIAFGLVAMSAIIVYNDHQYAIARTVAVVAVAVVMIAQVLYTRGRIRDLVAANLRLAEIDPLTGVANSRHFGRRLDEMIKRADRTGDDLVLFSLDLDNFKQVNDEMSHTIGDQLLTKVAQSIEQVLGIGDLIARRGGDEFLVLSSPTPENPPDRLAKAIEMAVVAARRDVAPGIASTASVGYVTRRAAESADQLIARSDQALHEAKLLVHPERRDGETNVWRFPVPSRPVHDRLDEQVNNSAPVDSEQSEWNPESTALQGAALWSFCSIGTAVLGVVGLAIIAACGVEAVESYLAFGALIVVSALCTTVGRRGGNAVGMTAVAVSSIGLLTIGIVFSGDVAAALVDLYLLPVLFAYNALPFERRPMLLVGLATMVICMTLHGVLLSAVDAPWAGLRTFIAVQILIVDSAATLRGKQSMRKLAALNLSLSGFDPLTGLANVRTFTERLRTESDRAEQFGRPFGLIMVDLDGFKQVNDHFDHSFGDQVLVESGRALSACAREDELVARRGGDEFAIVTGPIDPADLPEIAARVATMIADVRKAMCPDLVATASVGHAAWRLGDVPELIIERADNALHEAKVRHHDEYAMTGGHLQPASV